MIDVHLAPTPRPEPPSKTCGGAELTNDEA